ncbi:MAG: restriction endonuclease [Cyanobacteria bacterium P01_B01_bin.77]
MTLTEIRFDSQAEKSSQFTRILKNIMKGSDYEQLVRAVLVRKLNISPDELKSTREEGVTFPGDPELRHQIDLYHLDSTEIADYITIIECKWRTNVLVDQELLAKLAYVKGSLKASKAIMVTNVDFTAGARALAKAEKIALLKVVPDEEFVQEVNSIESRATADEFFDAVLSRVTARPRGCDTVVVSRLLPDPNDRGLDLIDQLLSDPTVRNEVEKFVNDPAVRETASRILRDNPDLERKARDFLRGRGGGLF